MSYIQYAQVLAQCTNIRDTFMLPILQKIESSSKATGLPREFFHYSCILGEALTSSIDTLIGVVVAAASLVLRNDHTIHVAQNLLSSTRKCLGNVFFRVLNIIDADIQLKQRTESNKIKVCCSGDGIFAGIYRQILANPAQEIAEESKNLVAKHLFTRIAYAAFILGVPLFRVMDLAVGIIAAIAAFSWLLLTEKSIDSLNNVAYRGLQIGGIVDDLYFAVMNLTEPGKIKGPSWHDKTVGDLIV